MPLYDFDWLDSGRRRHSTSIELADAEAARLHATQLAGDMLRAEPQMFIEDTLWQIRVANGDHVFSVMIVGTEEDRPAPGREPVAVELATNYARSGAGRA